MLIPATDWLVSLNALGYLAVAAVNVLLFVVIFIRFKSKRLYFSPLFIIESGFLIKKQITINPCKVYGINLIRTPVSSALNLSSAVIHTEGKRYMIPPTDNETCKKIIDLMKKQKRGI